MSGTPCHGCVERTAGCHAGCPRYAEYRAERDRQLHEKYLRVTVRETRRAAIERMERPWLMKRKKEGK